MSVMEYNGGSVIAMTGKNCVAIASDLRLGNQALLLSTQFDKVFKMTDRTYVGLPGLATDVSTLHEKFRYRLNMYRMKEDRDIEPETFAKLMSSTLYERRFGPYFIEPVVAGLPTDSNLGMSVRPLKNSDFFQVDTAVPLPRPEPDTLD